MNNDKEFMGTLNKPTPVSQQLSMIKTLSALVLSFFLKSLFNKTLFEITITNAVLRIRSLKSRCPRIDGGKVLVIDHILLESFEASNYKRRYRGEIKQDEINHFG